MSRFDTLGFSDLGTGDGVSRDFPIAEQDEAVTDFAVESVRRDGWQGRVLMSRNPRTNYATYSNDFTRPEWNGSPSLLLGFKDQRYFVVDSSGALQQKPFSDIITFTRAGGGGRTNAQGNYEWLPANTPRIDYDPVTGECLGLLIEESGTNFLTHSSDFTNAAWPLTGLGLGDKVVAPDGSLSATKLVPTAVAGNHFTTRGFTVADNTTVTLSVFVKRGEYRYFVLQGKTKDNQYPAASFDLDSGIARHGSTAGSATSGMELTQEGFYRCWLTWNVLSGASGLQFFMSCRGDSSSPSVFFTGDGTSGIYIWGAQLEAGSFPTSLIHTEGAQVTRAADIASVNVLSPWYNPEQGTLFVEAVPAGFAPSINTGWLSLDDGTTANVIEIRSWGSLKSIAAGRNAGGVAGSVIESNNQLSIGTVSRVALTYDATTGALAEGGDLLGSASYSALPSGINQLRIGRRPIGAPFTGHIDSIRYYPRALSSAELQAITA